MIWKQNEVKHQLLECESKLCPPEVCLLKKNVSGSFGEVFFDVRCMCEKKYGLRHMGYGRHGWHTVCHMILTSLSQHEVP